MKITKHLILIILLSLLAVKSGAQEQGKNDEAVQVKYPRTGYIIMGGGICLPTGNFHGTALNMGLLNNTIKSGFANNGFAGFTEFAIPVSYSNFGFAASTGYYNNPVNPGAMTNADDHFTGTRKTFTISATPYKTNTLLCGLYISLPRGKLTFDFKALAGFAVSFYPAITRSVYLGPLYTNTASAPATIDFTYGGNFTSRYSIKKHFCAFAQSGIFTTNQYYSMIESVFNLPRKDPTKMSKPNHETVVNLSAGLGYQF